jgi:hypothetical protein
MPWARAIGPTAATDWENRGPRISRAPCSTAARAAAAAPSGVPPVSMGWRAKSSSATLNSASCAALRSPWPRRASRPLSGTSSATRVTGTTPGGGVRTVTPSPSRGAAMSGISTAVPAGASASGAGAGSGWGLRMGISGGAPVSRDGPCHVATRSVTSRRLSQPPSTRTAVRATAHRHRQERRMGRFAIKGPILRLRALDSRRAGLRRAAAASAAQAGARPA